MLTQFQTGKAFVILITPGNGALSYVLGDVLTCEDAAVPLLSICGRTTLNINPAGEKTTIGAIEQNVHDLSAELGIRTGEFFVTCQIEQPADVPRKLVRL